MKRYKCHKEVLASKIVAAEYCKGTGPMGAWLFTYEDGEQELLRQEDPKLARWVPGVGDYKVDYMNGFDSFSPAMVFEDGYALVIPHHLQRGVADTPVIADGYSTSEEPAPAPHPQLAPSSLGAGDES
jgi:hypothetical protein